MAAPPVVGIDIGTQQIKIVEVRSGKSGLTVTAVGIAPTPVGLMQNNIITDPVLMGRTIKQLFKENGVKATKVVGSVAGQNAVVIRVIEVPKMTDAELKETMKWEVERHVPFAPAETIVDFQPITIYDPEGETNPNMEVLLAVAQQDIIRNFVDSIIKTGREPVAIDVEPLAVGRAMLDIVGGKAVVRPPAGSPPPSGFQETVAVVNMGATNTDITIYVDGELAFPRSLPLAGESLTRAIADTLDYPVEYAEKVKREHAFVYLDRMSVYTGTAYGEDFGYEGPELSFRDDELNFDLARESGRASGRISGRISGRSSGKLPSDDDILENPFSTAADPNVTDPVGSQFARPGGQSSRLAMPGYDDDEPIGLAGRPIASGPIGRPVSGPVGQPVSGLIGRPESGPIGQPLDLIGGQSPRSLDLAGDSPRAQPFLDLAGGERTARPLDLAGDVPTGQPLDLAGGERTLQPLDLAGGERTLQPLDLAGGERTAQPLDLAGVERTGQPLDLAGVERTGQPLDLAGVERTEQPLDLAGVERTEQPLDLAGVERAEQPLDLAGVERTEHSLDLASAVPTAQPMNFGDSPSMQSTGMVEDDFEESAFAMPTHTAAESAFGLASPDAQPQAFGTAFQEPEEPAFGIPGYDPMAGHSDVDEIDRTQPMDRRILNLATKGETDNPFLAPPPGEAAPQTSGMEVSGENQGLREQVFEAIAPVLGELATEIRRSLDYYRSRAQGRSVDRVMLCGGSAHLGNFAPFLQNELQVPVFVGDPFANMTVATKHFDPAYLQTISSTFTVAVGLAVRLAVFNANPAPKKPKVKAKPKAKGKGDQAIDPATLQAV